MLALLAPCFVLLCLFRLICGVADCGQTNGIEVHFRLVTTTRAAKAAVRKVNIYISSIIITITIIIIIIIYKSDDLVACVLADLTLQKNAKIAQHQPDVWKAMLAEVSYGMVFVIGFFFLGLGFFSTSLNRF